MTSLVEDTTVLLYFYQVTEQLFIVVTVLTLFYALSKTLLGRTGLYIQLGGTVLGLTAATIRAVSKALTTIQDVEINLYTFYVGFILMALSLLALALFSFRRAPKWGKIALAVCTSMLGAVLLFYKAWNVIYMPARFETAGEGVISWDFMERLAGWALTLILFAVYSRFLYRCLMRLSEDEALWMNTAGEKGHDWSLALLRGVSMASITVLLINFAGEILGKWRLSSSKRVRDPETRRRIQLIIYKYRPKWFGVPEKNSAYDTFESEFAIYVGNHTREFIIAIAILILIPLIVLLFRSLAERGHYANSAQHRRLKSNRRHNRRWVLVVALCLVLVVVNITFVKAKVEYKEPEPEPESYLVSEDKTQVLIPIDQVNDFNLHTFSMLTENNVTVRWLVVRKPGSGAYGVGLNACDVCGPAGYIQRGETVVCVKCDVVMNTNTIGLPGGCNPVPLAFKVEEGNIVIQMEDLIAAESRFKNR